MRPHEAARRCSTGCSTAVLHGAATPQTRAVLAAQLESPEITRDDVATTACASDTDVAKLAALVLGSPEFQRR